MPTATEEITVWLAKRLEDADLQVWTEKLLVNLCEADTTLGIDIGRLRQAESLCFDLLTEACKQCLPEETVVRRLPVQAEISALPEYTVPRYAGRLENDPAAVYGGRCNLLITLNGYGSEAGWLLNAHVDTVPPHIPPTLTHDSIRGRGTVDDKGGIVAALLAARLITEWTQHSGHVLPPVQILISIDEEMGGNGTLAALSNVDISRQHVVVLEPTGLQPYPANRGAVWFTIDVDCPPDLCGSVLRDVVLALAKGAAYEREHFPHHFFSPDDVSFCLGILNSFGSHPAAACERVELSWRVNRGAVNIKKFLREVKKRLKDDSSIQHHSDDPDVQWVGDLLQVTVFAVPGHMGSNTRDSDAIVKAAAVIDVAMGHGLQRLNWPSGLIHLEGGQGFLPGRTLEDVKHRLQTSVREALEYVPRLEGDKPVGGEIRFDRLQNEAYASSPNAPTATLLAKSVEALTGVQPEPLSGWSASCDARLFAAQSGDVVTFGPGQLEAAHGPAEQITLSQILLAAGAITIAVCE